MRGFQRADSSGGFDLEETKEIKKIFIITIITGLIAISSVIVAGGFQDLSETTVNPSGYILITEGILVLLLPFIFLAIYILYGKEKNVTVPEYLSTIPNKNRTPFEVNLLFKGSAFVSDHDAFYATLLDLHRKKKISIKDRGNNRDVLIKVLEEEGDSSYEQGVMNFLMRVKEIMGRGVVDTWSLERLTRKMRPILTKTFRYGEDPPKEDIYKFYEIRRYLRSLMYISKEELSKEHAVSKRWFVLLVTLAGVFLFFYNLMDLSIIVSDLTGRYTIEMLFLLQFLLFGGLIFVFMIYGLLPEATYFRPFVTGYCVLTFFLFPLFLLAYSPEIAVSSAAILILSGAVVTQGIVAYSASSMLFGHWKEDYYKEKLEWNAFRKFLSDFHNLEECDQTDLDLWNEWLVYGTALGVGPQVSRQTLKVISGFEYSCYFVPDYNWFATFQNMYDS